MMPNFQHIGAKALRGLGAQELVLSASLDVPSEEKDMSSVLHPNHEGVVVFLVP